jgi:glycosyltransferase involved in cell wall biosynthesis
MLKSNPVQNSDIWCVIPTFNNKDTIQDIALGCRKHLTHVLIVDDGSTQGNIRELFNSTDITVLKHPKNLGKGQSIRTALDYILKQGGKFMITIDADGQHYPQDIDKFISALEEDQASIIIGFRDFKQSDAPGKSQFGRSFSNFWIRLETGSVVGDSQSGFRCYPVEYISKIKTGGNYYDFETEILTRGRWAGLKLREVPVNVFYPQANLRVTSFRPIIDNLRISLMHIRLLGRRLVPLPYPKVIQPQRNAKPLNILMHPIKLLNDLLKENATPFGLAISAAVGIILGALPLLSIHMLAVLYVTNRLHLNKIMALSIQNICMPPFVPIACIELGHFILYRKWLTDISWQTTLGSLPARIWEWLLGSLIIAPLLGVIAGIIIYFSAQIIQRRVKQNAASS